MKPSKVAPQKQAINQLYKDVHSFGDFAQMEDWEDELQKERAATLQHLGDTATPKLVEHQGVVVEEAQVQAARDAGQEVNLPTTVGRQAQ